MKTHLLILMLICTAVSAVAQKYMSDQTSIRFYSSAPVEDIDATNISAKSVIDSETGKFAFSVPSNQFMFKKKLMQQHFNENYMESEKYPKSTFTGIVKKWKPQVGDQDVTAEGELTIHGVTNTVSIAAQLNQKDNRIIVDSTFPIALAAYKIKIPKALFYNIADTVEVTVHFEYELLAK